MGLLAIISCHVGPLVFYLFSWTFIAHLLYFCLSLCLWAYWLLLPMMLARWPFTSFVGLPFPLYFYHVSFILFLLHLPSLLEFYFLLLGFLSKTDINIQLLEHVNCLYNSYMNTFAVFFFTGFLNSGPHISFSSMNKIVLSNFLVYLLF